MTVVSEVISIPRQGFAEIQPDQDEAWRITSLVTEDECGVRFQTNLTEKEGEDDEIEYGRSGEEGNEEEADRTKLIFLDHENLRIETFIRTNHYIIIEGVDEKSHTAFYSAEVTE